MTENESLSYTKLYEKLVDRRGRISHRDYSYNLKKMYKERWLSKHDENIRGKRVGISIASEGKLAHRYSIKLEDSTKLNRSFQLLLISASMEMIYLEKVIEGHETTSIFDYDPQKAKSAYYSSYTKEGVNAEDLLEKQGRPTNGIFAHLNFQESEIMDLFGFFHEKNLFEKRLITAKGKRKSRYFLIESEFKKCIISCITMLHTEVESRMFYVWKTIRKPKGPERDWYKRIHGSEKWREIEITLSE